MHKRFGTFCLHGRYFDDRIAIFQRPLVGIFKETVKGDNLLRRASKCIISRGNDSEDKALLCRIVPHPCKVDRGV